jgi:hypothetical protein
LTREQALDLGARAAAGLAVVGAIGTLLASGPYLSTSEGIEAWLLVYALGVFGLLLFAPFALHRRIAESRTDRDRRWELAIVVWGGVALAAALAFGLVLGIGPGSTEPLGALALMGLLECALVVVAVLTLILTTG